MARLVGEQGRPSQLSVPPPPPPLQRQRLQAAEQQLAGQAVGRQCLEGARVLSLEGLQRDMGARQQQLEELDAQLQRSSRASQLQQLRSRKEIKQVGATRRGS